MSLPAAHIVTLAPYHLLRSNAEVDDWLHSSDSADVVLAMPVKQGYQGLAHLGSDGFKERIGQRLHFYPNLHCDAFFPFFGYAKNGNGETLTYHQCPGNPHGDYHDFLAMAIADSRIKWGRIQRFRLKLAARTQGSLLLKIARQSIVELHRRVSEMKSSLASERIPLGSLCGYTMNHPSAQLLNILYASIWSRVLHGDPHLFKPLEYEPFADGTALPVVDFAARALKTLDASLQFTALPRRPDPFENYEEALKRAVKLYERDSSIIATNRDHNKFKLAKRFLSFSLK